MSFAENQQKEYRTGSFKKTVKLIISITKTRKNTPCNAGVAEPGQFKALILGFWDWMRRTQNPVS